MSSIIGHASVGAALFLSRSAEREASPRLALLLVLLAILPDFDYLAFWLFGIDCEPRFTHSLALAIAAALIAWACMKMVRDPARRVPLVALLLAAGSHGVLDLLVGVHPVCVLWPLPLPELQSPLGLLPSAGPPQPHQFLLLAQLADRVLGAVAGSGLVRGHQAQAAAAPRAHGERRLVTAVDGIACLVDQSPLLMRDSNIFLII